jgi:hypothetical protein
LNVFHASGGFVWPASSLHWRLSSPLLRRQ